MEHAPTWLTYGFLYLTAAVLAVPIAKALGLGAIIGYLAAGIAIGPWGLGLVSNVQDILHFAEFGVVLMLFLVGLELQPSRLWALRRPIFGTGTAQVLGCAAVLFALGALAGLPWRVSLVGALGLALSSTAIALQVLAERNLMRTSSGQAGFSILLFQDVAAIPILALLPVLGAAAGEGAGHTPGEMVLEVLKIVGVIAAIILGGRLLLRPVLREIVFSDPAQRKALEAITHPAIRETLERELTAADSPYAILASPLLWESGQSALVRRTLLVDAPEHLQIARASARDGVSPGQIEAILKAQWSREQRLARADDVLLNDGTLAALQAGVERLHAGYLREAST
mgnify:CR=1 FL=1